MAFELPTLPYAMDALSPFISSETLSYHHGKHHAKYVATLNELIQETPYAAMTLTEIIKNSDGAIFNNAAQTFNHTFYWNCLSPETTAPSPLLEARLQQSFGSVEAFKDAFNRSALGLFGSGWTWLCLEETGKLAIKNGSNADTPLRWGDTPLLTCDVWEHAYYIDYRNARNSYLDAFWKVVNWQFVSGNLS